jgi:hypothetical protein
VPADHLRDGRLQAEGLRRQRQDHRQRAGLRSDGDGASYSIVVYLRHGSDGVLVVGAEYSLESGRVDFFDGV